MEEKLSEAIISGELKTLEDYIDTGNDFKNLILKSPDGYGKKPIELAILSQIHFEVSSKITQLVLENSSEQDIAEVLISFASEDNHLEKMKILLDSGASVDLAHNDQTALQRATGNRNLKMVYLLLMYGASPIKNGIYGTALEEAKTIHYEPAFLGMMESFIKGEPKSPFDFVDTEKVIDQLSIWLYSLKIFANEHKGHTFYALALDGGTLKANSEEAFEETLKNYQDQFPEKYTQAEKIKALKYSIGDFSFHKIEKEISTSERPILNIDLTFLEKQINDNRTEKELLIEGLIKNKEQFTKMMRVTNDFRILNSRHSY